MADGFWETWAGNYPLEVDVEPADKELDLPKRIVLTRAGKSVILSVDEAQEILQPILAEDFVDRVFRGLFGDGGRDD